MLQGLMGWLDALPLGTLYVAIAGLAAFENFFPPFPSDAVVAFGSFLASRAHGSALTVLFLGWFGNVAGATATYILGHRFGGKAFLHRIEKYAGPTAEDAHSGSSIRSTGSPVCSSAAFSPACAR